MFTVYSLNSDKWVSSHDHNGWVVAIALILTGAKTIIEKSIKVNTRILKISLTFLNRKESTCWSIAVMVGIEPLNSYH